MPANHAQFSHRDVLPALGLALVGCLTQPQLDCRSSCGEGLIGSLDCAGFQLAEDRAVRALDPVLDGGVCPRLNTWVVEVVRTDGGSWIDAWGRKVGGLTWCDYRTAQIGTDQWRNSAYSHELVHALDCPRENGAHTGWADAGIFQAITDANGPDSTQPVDGARAPDDR